MAVGVGFVAFIETSTLVQTLVSLPILLFLPGYFVLAVLFPAETYDQSTTIDTEGVDTFERLVLSYGTSLALLTMIALLIPLLPLTLTTETLLSGVVVVVVVCTPLAIARRIAVSESQRYEPIRNPSVTETLSTFNQGDRQMRVLNVVLALSVVAGLGITVGVILAPLEPNPYTEVSLLTENSQDELEADGYPDSLDGPHEPLVLKIANEEGQATDYTVVVELQQVETGESSTVVLQREKLRQMSTRIGAGKTWTRRHTLEPEMTGEDLRLVYYVYIGDAPDEPSLDTAYRSVHLWVDVSAR